MRCGLLLPARRTISRGASVASLARHNTAYVAFPQQPPALAADSGAAVKCAGLQVLSLAGTCRRAQRLQWAPHCTVTNLFVKPAPRLQLHLRQSLLSMMRHGARVRAHCRQSAPASDDARQAASPTVSYQHSTIHIFSAACAAFFQPTALNAAAGTRLLAAQQPLCRLQGLYRCMSHTPHAHSTRRQHLSRSCHLCDPNANVPEAA